MRRAAWVLALLPAYAAATAPVPAWASRLSEIRPMRTFELHDERVLADGTRQLLVSAETGVVVVRGDAASGLSSTHLPGTYTGFSGRWSTSDSLGRVFVAMPGPRVAAFDGRTGAPLWSGPSPLAPLGVAHGDQPQDVAVDEPPGASQGSGDVFLAATGFAPEGGSRLDVYRLDAWTGQVVWGPLPLRRDRPFVSPRVLPAPGGIVVSVLDHGCAPWEPFDCPNELALVRLDRASGAVVWETPVSAAADPDGLVDPRGRIVTFGPTVRSFRELDGSLDWSRDLTSLLGTEGALGQTLDPSGHVIVSNGTRLMKLDGSTGRTAWGPVTLPHPADDVTADRSGFLLAAARSTSQVSGIDGGTGRVVWTSASGSPGRRWGAVAVTPAGTALVLSPISADGGVWMREMDGTTGAALGAAPALDRSPLRTHPEVHLHPSGDVLLYGATGLSTLGGAPPSSATRTVSRIARSSGREVWRATLTDALGAEAFGGGAPPPAPPGVRGVGSSVAAAAGVAGVFALGRATDSLWVERLDAETGGKLFRVPAGGTGASTTGALGLPADGTLRVAVDLANEVEVRSLSTSSGATLSRRVLTGRRISGFDASSGDLLVTSGGRLSRVDSVTGAVRWTALPSSASSAGAAFFSGGAVLLSTSAGAMALEASTGRTLWGPVLTGDTSRSVTDSEGGVLTVLSHGPARAEGVSRMGPRTGEVAWTWVPEPGGDAAPFISKVTATQGAALVFLSRCVARGGECRTSLVALKLEDGAPLWEVDLADAVPPLSAIQDGRGLVVSGRQDPWTLATSFTTSLGFLPADPLPAAVCGRPYAASLHAANGTPPLAFRLESGTLPRGLTLAADGTVSGTPADEPGVYAPRVIVEDAAGEHAAMGLSVTLGGSGHAAILVEPRPDGSYRLTAGAPGDDVRWLPSGSLGASILVSPAGPTAHGASVRGVDLCRALGTVRLGDVRPDLPGDVDANGRLDIFDVVALTGFLVGNVTPGGAPFLASRAAADLDGDGDADVLDVLALAIRIVGGR